MNKVRSSGKTLRVFALFVALVVIFGASPVRHHLRALSLLRTLAGAPEQAAAAAPPHVYDLRLPSGKARAFVPAKDAAGASALPIVLVHGIHYRGIDEPRFTKFAQALTASGSVVLTPELSDLADYQLRTKSKDDISGAVHYLHDLTGKKVALVGVSFGGGLAISTAAEERVAKEVAFVVSVGGHGDVERVSRYLLSGHAPRPDGSTLDLPSHDYGVAVFSYEHVDDLFAADDRATATRALRAWLHEDAAGAKREASSASAAGRKKLERIFEHDSLALADELSRVFEAHREELRQVSPSTQASRVEAPVFLLHGAGDNVVPPTEAEWLAKELPNVRSVLVSPALVHVELGKKDRLVDQWNLVHFMAGVLSGTSA
ncbi:MAG: alpha/beta hydrolase [Polyangiaceae bacterium]